MFCPTCGTSNPDTGRFCRSCGAVLANSAALQTPQKLVNHKGKPIHLEGAITKMFMGVAFLLVTAALVASGSGKGWWFWMLIPAFSMLGAGVAQYIQIRRYEKGQPVYTPGAVGVEPARSGEALPPAQTEFVHQESRFKTGDLVPPSVAEGTTRNLEVDREGKTMTLPRD